MRKKFIGAVVLATLGFTIAACDTDAAVVSDNLSKAADQFEITRRIIFFNGITDKYIMTIEGKCSIEAQDKKLNVTCKTQGGEYKKHFLGLSDNVTWFAEQLESASVDPNHYRVIFKPEALIPDIDRP